MSPLAPESKYSVVEARIVAVEVAKARVVPSMQNTLTPILWLIAPAFLALTAATGVEA
jgi:hypothetical protein